MLENSVWRQYNEELNIAEHLRRIYEPWEMEVIEDEVELHNTLKAKLTKKEFRLFAMQCGDVEDAEIKKRFGYSDEELQEAVNKLYKKLKQDKVRLALRA